MPSFLLLSRISVSVRCGLQVLAQTPSFILKKGKVTEKEATVLRSVSLLCKVSEPGSNSCPVLLFSTKFLQ